MRKTKIVCTIGPATDKREMLEKLILAGMNVARLNFSHGDYKEFSSIIKDIKALSKKHHKDVAILQDLQGLKIRLGKLTTSPMVLEAGQVVCFTTNSKCEKGEIPVQYKRFGNDVQVGQRVLIADGQVQLKVLSKKGDRVYLKVVHGGMILDHKGINIPDTSVGESPITEKDKRDIRFGVQHGVDYIALSFVRNKYDVMDLRKLIMKAKGKAKVIAKIEIKEALQHLPDIIEESDGIMVARGDLGVEISYEKVPLIQKEIIHMTNQAGKPVITATQMLMSMVISSAPTRAEVSDIANAILDKSDALMLSDETAVGKYPLQAVDVLHKTALEVEQNFIRRRLFWKDRDTQGKIPSIAISYHGIPLAEDLQAQYIVIFTVAGFSALQVARFRPRTPMVVYTLSEDVKRQLSLIYGINEVYVLKSFDDKLRYAIPHLIRTKHLKKGDRLIIISAGKEIKEGSMDEIRAITIQ